MNKDKWEKSLQKRLEQKPSREFDGVFWRKFEARFDKKTDALGWLNFRRAAPLLVACGLIAAVGVQGYYRFLRTASQARFVVDHADFLEDLDMFEGLNEEALTASDEEWDILLHGQHGEDHADS